MSSSPLNETVCLSSRQKFLFLQILTFPGWYINSQRPLCFPANTACPVWRMHSAPALQDSVFPIVSGSSEPGNDRKYSWECSLLLEFGPLPHPSVTVHHGPLLRRPVPQHNISIVPTFYSPCLCRCPQRGLSWERDEARTTLKCSESSRDRLVGCI